MLPNTLRKRRNLKLKNKIIITPAYYIDAELRAEIEATEYPTVILTDDCSPVFPLDRRTEWLEKTLLRRDLVIDSIIQNDESSEFAEAVKKKIESLGIEDAEIVLFSHTPIEIEGVTNKIVAGPLGIKSDELDPTFTTRFGDEFIRYTQPKVKAIPNEKHYLIAKVWEKTANEWYYGIICKYPSLELSPLEIETGPLLPTAEMKIYLSYWAKSVFGIEVETRSLLGTVKGHSVWMLEGEAPELLKPEVQNGNRMYLSLDADVLFLPQHLFRQANEVFSWAYVQQLIETEVAMDEPSEEQLKGMS